MKIYITGPSGAGATTLAKDLSNALSIKHIDSDDLFWMKSDPPYTKIRSANELQHLFACETSVDSYVLSGDVLHWGLSDEQLLHTFTHIVFLCLPFEIREKRIRNREIDKFGKRILPGGDLFEQHENFVLWTKNYDQNNAEQGRNRKSQVSFLSNFSGKILRVEHEELRNLLLEKTLNFLK